MRDAFRHAIAQALADSFNRDKRPPFDVIVATPEAQGGYSDAVLAMPEMQWLRRYVAHNELAALDYEDQAGDPMPPAVREWVQS